jgi:PPP family 3-phenylpropionic acid transporter
MYLVYLCYFAVDGIIHPFWPAWLKSLGYGNGQVGLLLAATYWPQVLVGLVLTYLADWRFGPLKLAAVAALLSSLCVFLFSLPPSIPLYLLLGMLYGGLWATVLPLSETFLLMQDKASNHDYGRVRAAGSLAFIAMSLAGGAMIDFSGLSIVPWAVASLMLLTALPCLLLARRVARQETRRHSQGTPYPDWRRLWGQTALLLGLAAAGFIQLSHCLYFATASNVWSQQGYSPTWIGAFWSLAVLAEIAFFARSSGMLNRLEPLTIIALSGLCAALRWSLALFDGGTASILFGQLLHALSFAAYHAALMRHIRDRAPEDVRALVQGLYYAFAVALPMGAVTPLACLLLDATPERANMLMIVFALMGAAIAAIARKYRPGAVAILRRPL